MGEKQGKNRYQIQDIQKKIVYRVEYKPPPFPPLSSPPPHRRYPRLTGASAADESALACWFDAETAGSQRSVYPGKKLIFYFLRQHISEMSKILPCTTFTNIIFCNRKPAAVVKQKIRRLQQSSDSYEHTIRRDLLVQKTSTQSGVMIQNLVRSTSFVTSTRLVISTSFVQFILKNTLIYITAHCAQGKCLNCSSQRSLSARGLLAPRIVYRIIFSVWRHSEEQVYLGYNHYKSQHRVRIPCLSRRAGEGKKGNLLFTSTTQCLRNFCDKIILFFRILGFS